VPAERTAHSATDCARRVGWLSAPHAVLPLPWLRKAGRRTLRCLAMKWQVTAVVGDVDQATLARRGVPAEMAVAGTVVHHGGAPHWERDQSQDLAALVGSFQLGRSDAAGAQAARPNTTSQATGDCRKRRLGRCGGMDRRAGWLRGGSPGKRSRGGAPCSALLRGARFQVDGRRDDLPGVERGRMDGDQVGYRSPCRWSGVVTVSMRPTGRLPGAPRFQISGRARS